VQDTVQSEIRTVLDDTTAPVHRMSSVPDERSSQEADLGDEHHIDGRSDSDGRSDIDGLSDGGTFS
jgi:hypothetical protein